MLELACTCSRASLGAALCYSELSDFELLKVGQVGYLHHGDWKMQQIRVSAIPKLIVKYLPVHPWVRV